MNNLYNLLTISIITTGIACGAEHIDYIDSAQVKAYGDMISTQTPSIRNCEMTESTSTSDFVFCNFSSFQNTVDNILKEWNIMVSYAEGEIR